ncbi:MAG: T9SS type A sorting domain-containing protein, partial [Bacteroidia bacterium]|nr:T9SS type A sorting domain-containing protein [Bacteroidia bacterium]
KIMKKLLLTVTSTSILSFAFAQNKMITNKMYQEKVNLPASSSFSEKTTATCSDTLMNFAPTATLTVYRAGTHGYVCGTNDYNDLEKAEWFAASTYTGITNPIVNGVLVGFYRDPSGSKGTVGTPTVPVNLIVYDGNATSGPSTAVGTYTATLGTIAAAQGTSAIVWYYYTGSNIPIANPSVGFFTSVQIPDGTVAGDTAVIFSASVTNNTAWEKWSDNNWYDFVTSWNAKMSMAMLPIITGSCVTTAIGDNYDLNQAINILPNPSTTGKAYITGSFPVEQNISVEIVNLLGQTILNAENRFKTGMIPLELDNLENGVYFINISNGSQKISRRLIINK